MIKFVFFQATAFYLLVNKKLYKFEKNLQNLRKTKYDFISDNCFTFGQLGTNDKWTTVL